MLEVSSTPRMNSFVHYFRFLIYFSLITFIQGTVTQIPSTACVGDRITVSCILTPPAGQTFTALTPRFLIGNSDTSLSANNINNSVSHPDVDLNRLTAYTNAGSQTMVSGVVTLLSYLTSDGGLRIGCEVALNNGMDLIENIQLIQSAPPSAPSLQSSVSNFNTSTCSADISLSWDALPSDRTVDRYFLYLDGSPLATTNSNSYNHSTILNINTDYQYSVTAMNCAGSSTNSSSNVSVASYSLMNSSQYVCLAYDEVTGGLTVNWELSVPTQPSGVSGLDISYSLQLLYSHSRQGVTYTYTDSTSFTLPSSQLSYNTTITAHNFTQLDGVETNITANLMIVQQCGQSFSGAAMECFFNSKNPPTTPISTSSLPISSTTVETTTSSNPISSTTVEISTSSNPISSTTVEMTNSSNPIISSTSLGINSSNDTPPPSLPIIIIIGSGVGAVILLFILITFIILLLILILFLRKRKANPKQTGTNGTDTKDYQELEDTHSEVKKKSKPKPEPVKKDECELTYLEIDHSSGTGKIVKPPIIPKTNYADITSFPQETQYASLQN